jgi:hypothetical protein
MYGKSFQSMYEGSMVGLPPEAWCIWHYCIAKNRFGIVELNPKILGFIHGITEKDAERGISILCAPDPKSRSKAEEGRRLIREGEYQYRMVNWEVYDRIKSEDARREYNRLKQAEHRAKKRATRNVPTMSERLYEKAVADGVETP